MGDNRLREFRTREKINGGPDTLGRRLSTGLSGVGFKQPVCASQLPLSEKHAGEPGWSLRRARSRGHQNDRPGADQRQTGRRLFASRGSSPYSPSSARRRSALESTEQVSTMR